MTDAEAISSAGKRVCWWQNGWHYGLVTRFYRTRNGHACVDIEDEKGGHIPKQVGLAEGMRCMRRVPEKEWLEPIIQRLEDLKPGEQLIIERVAPALEARLASEMTDKTRVL